MKKPICIFILMLGSLVWGYTNEPDPGTYVTPDPNNPQVGDVYDLKLNWAEVSNPNGQWEYGYAGGAGWAGVASYTSNWRPSELDPNLVDPNGQPAWAGGAGDEGWAQSVNDNPFGKDILVGDMFGHAWTSARWISPAKCTVRVTGNAWSIGGGTANLVECWVMPNGTWDGEAVRVADLDPSTHTRSNPAEYDLTFNVDADQRIAFLMGIKAGYAADFGAGNMTVEITAFPDPPTGHDYPNQPASAPPLPDPANVQVGDTWDMKYNWNDTSNANGQWEYGGADAGGGIWPGVFATSQSDWLAGDFHDPNPQPAWADSAGGVPGWCKSVNDYPFGKDILTGDVVGYANVLARWVSPDFLTVRVTGNGWMIRDVGRVNELWICPDGVWTGNAVKVDNLDYDTYYRDSTAKYDMQFDVVPDQAIALLLAGGNDFSGVNMTIEVLSINTPVPVCVSRPTMDFTNDCWVNMEDFAVFALQWLECGLDIQESCFIE